jgi:hypothetical protein
MFTRKFFGALGLVATIGLGSAAAQESTVIVLRSGERVNAQLIDLSRQGFYVNIGGTERHLNPADIAAISFQGDIADADWAAAVDGTAVLVLRNGQRVQAELTDIGGTTPLLLTIRDAAGERELRSSDIARIIWARPANTVTTPTGTGGGPGIVVAANQQWVSTGITVGRNQTVQFQSSGEVRLSTEQADLASINGSATQRYAAGSPMPRVLAGALIGRIGNGAPFAIGSQTSVVMPAAGILYLGVNDNSPNDNEGHFNVVVTPVGRARR